MRCLEELPASGSNAFSMLSTEQPPLQRVLGDAAAAKRLPYPDAAETSTERSERVDRLSAVPSSAQHAEVSPHFDYSCNERCEKGVVLENEQTSVLVRRLYALAARQNPDAALQVGTRRRLAEREASTTHPPQSSRRESETNDWRQRQPKRHRGPSQREHDNRDSHT